MIRHLYLAWLAVAWRPPRGVLGLTLCRAPRLGKSALLVTCGPSDDDDFVLIDPHWWPFAALRQLDAGAARVLAAMHRRALRAFLGVGPAPVSPLASLDLARVGHDGASVPRE